jgi:curli biogenesis system outer membrane secretion channel CsgG
MKRILTLALILFSGSALADRPVLGVAEFTNEVAGVGWWGGSVGWELSDMLASELAAIGAFTVVERTNLEAVMREQDLGASGRVRPDTAAQIGQLTGAQYIVLGTVSAYSEETARSGGGVNLRGVNIGGRSTNIGVGGSRTQAYIAVDLRVVDANTGELAHVRTVEGRTSDTGVNLRAQRGWIGGNLAHQENTPAGEAIRAALIEITDYLECSMVLKTSSCLAEYQQREDTRRERTRSRLRF